MSIFGNLRNAVAEILTPGARRTGQESEYLRQVHPQCANLLPNQFYRLTGSAGQLVGFYFHCICGMGYQLLDVNAWLSESTCRCGQEVDLFKFLGISLDTPRSEWQRYFAKLPSRPRIVNRPPQRIFSTESLEQNTTKDGLPEYERSNIAGMW